MNNESRDTRRRRRVSTATLGCTAAVAVMAGTFVAPAAQASSLSDRLGGTGSSAPAPSSPAIKLPTLATVDGTGTGLAVGVGGDLVSVGLGSGSSSGSGLSVDVANGTADVTAGGSSTVSVDVPAVGSVTTGGTQVDVGQGGTVPVPVPSSATGSGAGAGTTQPSAPTGSSTEPGATTGTGNGGATSGSTPASPAAVRIISAGVSKSVAILYPKKDGYRDSVTFTVTHETSTGAVVPVSGSATLTRAGKTVKTWALVRSTQKLVWNGLVDGDLKPGTYTLKATAKAEDGRTWTSATKATVSGKRLVTKAVALRTGAVTKLTHKTMPKPARSSLVKGLPVTLRVTTWAKGLKGTGKLVFTDGVKSFSIPVKSGKHASKWVHVPMSFTKVHMKPSLRAKSGRVTAVRLVWRYGMLK